MRETCACCSGPGAVPLAGRRTLLRGAAGLLCAAVGGGAALAQVTGGVPRSLRIHRMQTEESFAGVYWQDGRYDR